jgi:hypothetical protein
MIAAPIASPPVRGRRIGSNVCMVLASVCLIVALLTGYLRTTVLDSNQFADRATSALSQEPVRDLIARQITEQAVLRANRDLIAVRPVVETAAAAVVSTGAFRSLFHTAVRDLHRTVFSRDRSTATLTLLDVGVLLSSALEQFAPDVAKQLPVDFSAKLDAGETALNSIQLANAADAFERYAWIFGLLTAALLAGGIALAPRRTRAIVHAGISIAVAGAIIAIAYQIGRSAVLGRFSAPDDRAAAGAVWDAFLLDLRTWALIALAAGTVVAAAAASVLRPVDVRVPMRRAWEVVAVAPVTPWRRVARALALIVAGVLFIAWRQALLDIALVLVGVYILYQGVAELLRLLTETRAREDAAAPQGAAEPRRRRAAPWIAGGVAALLLVVLAGALIGTGATKPAAAAEATTCNGYAQLCDRPLDEVAFAGTHNAMSSPTYPNWLFAQQEKGLTGQLDDGIRALLIDAHFGNQVGGHVLTDLTGRDERKAAEESLGERGFQAAMRIRDSLIGGNAPRGPRKMWLCHGFCEVGAIPLTQGLQEVTDFVVRHPRQVVLIVIQDEGPTPQDLKPAFDDAGLTPYVYKGDLPKTREGWPTLGELIDSGQRVVVMVEKHAYDPAVPWIHNAYDYVQETPYHFTNPSQFSCAENRGPKDAPLFLLNHWIDTSPAPRPSNAAKVNTYAALLGRARECERERGQMPNILAVDFYKTGDVLKVVNTLNRIPSQ